MRKSENPPSTYNTQRTAKLKRRANILEAKAGVKDARANVTRARADVKKARAVGTRTKVDKAMNNLDHARLDRVEAKWARRDARKGVPVSERRPAPTRELPPRTKKR